MDAESRCQSCGGALPNGALGGLCPACLLRQGLEENPSAVGNTGSFARVTHGPVTPGALAALTESLGAAPQTLLRDSDPGPLVLPGSPEMPSAVDRPGRLQLLGEIARGGMGAVLKGRDNDIGRDLAVKVLLESHRDKPDLVRRFIEEAQIGGQLQHPGIVPIYELGAFADRRPYFAMKLVKGRTLSSLLDERPDPAGDLPRFLSILEAVCQTMAYAHARGVIHRDLKPSNIMVGSFGEVQVMDWGLAKVLPQGGVVDDSAAGKTKERETVIATTRSGSAADSDLSRAGSVLGTPSYMAPEQARGEIDRLDERCDVFALGSILCELLTGEPAFTGRSSGEIQRKASRGDLKEALERLDRSGTDAELIALAKGCLAPELEDRPRHAGAVSERITAYRTGVAERLRKAEIARAAETARAEEAVKRAHVERHRLRLTIALAASILGFVIVGGCAGFWLFQQRQARLASVDATIARIQSLRDQAGADGADPALWTKALAAADQALASVGDLVASAPGRRLAFLRAKIAEDTEQAERDRKLIADLAHVRTTRGLSIEHPDDRYAEVFKLYGLDLATISADRVIVRLKSLPENFRRQIVEFLDDWAFERDASGSDVAKSLAVARGLDPDPERNRLRSLLEQPDLRAQIDNLRALAKNADVNEFGASTALLLALALEKAGDKNRAIDVLRAAIVRNPGDLWLNLELAGRLARTEPPQTAEAIRYFSVARAIRPASGYELAELLEGQGKHGDAEAILRELVRLQPGFRSYGDLVGLLKRLGRRNEAHEVLSRWLDWLRLEPAASLAHLKIALVLRWADDRAGEIAELRQAARLDPRNAFVQVQLARSLLLGADLAGAIEAFREATRLDPGYINCNYELAFSLCLSGDHAGEVAALRNAIGLEPTAPNKSPWPTLEVPGPEIDSVQQYLELTEEFAFSVYFLHNYDRGHLALGNALVESGDLPGAMAAYGEAIRLKESDETEFHTIGTSMKLSFPYGPFVPRYALGQVLAMAGDFPVAIAGAREAIRLQSELATSEFGFSLCLALARSGDLPGAIAALSKTIQSKRPDRAEILQMLGPIAVAYRSNDTVKALRRLREAVQDDRALVEWVNRAITLTEKMVRFGPLVPRIFHAEHCGPGRHYIQRCDLHRFYAASAYLWSAAFEADATLEAVDTYRYAAARAAALAGCGQGRDDPQPDEPAKIKLRRQALDWLRADLAAQRMRLEGGKPEDRAGLGRTLRRWQSDPDLAGLREEGNLRKLPDDERKAWQTLWADVNALLKKDRSP